MPIANFHPYESTLFISAEGVLFWPMGGGPQLWPQAKFRGLKRPEVGKLDHFQSFVDACLGGPRPQCEFSRTGPMAEAVLLGTVAVRVPGQVLQWDTKPMKIANSADAEKLLRRNYRAGW